MSTLDAKPLLSGKTLSMIRLTPGAMPWVLRTHDAGHVRAVAFCVGGVAVVCARKVILEYDSIGDAVAIAVGSEGRMVEVGASVDDDDAIAAAVDAREARVGAHIVEPDQARRLRGLQSFAVRRDANDLHSTGSVSSRVVPKSPAP